MSIRISSAVEGFRRAGIAHSMVAKTYPDDFFSAKQLEQLKAEPRLAVAIIPDSAADGAPASAPAEPQGALVPGVLSDRLAGAPGDHLLQPLIEIIAGLDPEDASVWNQDGTPKAAVFPKGTGAADRANAWELFQAQASEA
ncbi:HI1506-related protein [Marinobacterium rhizophilum]|uniref:Mu-like prophage FluMu N-terminal domain-containing protein n=1 Tax=Marinobacterium rhizophilum TaxID=420402 RepID=A0ABY5HP20_9GAMM|nr:HI1506-related protein [Marinobacterium rhizophilum]UTW12935.1 hypothetical protein KDW95_04475 [Marinobacterium rhizophilum]